MDKVKRLRNKFCRNDINKISEDLWTLESFNVKLYCTRPFESLFIAFGLVGAKCSCYRPFKTMSINLIGEFVDRLVG